MRTRHSTATAEEKRRFVEFFSQYLEDTYRTKIEAYTGQRVEYLGEQVRKDRAIVDTQIVTEAVRIPITYRLKKQRRRMVRLRRRDRRHQPGQQLSQYVQRDNKVGRDGRATAGSGREDREL